MDDILGRRSLLRQVKTRDLPTDVRIAAITNIQDAKDADVLREALEWVINFEERDRPLMQYAATLWAKLYAKGAESPLQTFVRLGNTKDAELAVNGLGALQNAQAIQFLSKHLEDPHCKSPWTYANALAKNPDAAGVLLKRVKRAVYANASCVRALEQLVRNFPDKIDKKLLSMLAELHEAVEKTVYDDGSSAVNRLNCDVVRQLASAELSRRQ